MIPNDIPDQNVREWYQKKTRSQNQHVNLPTIIQIELTKNCNNACIMCHKGQMAAGEDFVKTDISNLILKQIEPIFPNLKYAMLFGDGEPMLYKNFWKVVTDIRTASPNCAIDFINNGSLMNELGIRNCLKHQVSHLGLSMGGATRKTHEYIRKLSNFDKVVENYKNLKKAKENANTKEPYVSTLIVGMDSNIEEMPQFIELADSIGAIRVNCQQLFVTHPSMKQEIVKQETAEHYFKKTQQIATKLGIAFQHYPLDSGNYYGTNHNKNKINTKDKNFANKYIPISNGYCASEQPWNTVYVLHDGKVVPDCHWWTSSRQKELNNCGTLDENTNIIDIWYDKPYQKIRESIELGIILPQCRGCGLAGGVRKQFRCPETDHIDPEQEKPDLIQMTVQNHTNDLTTHENGKTQYSNWNLYVEHWNKHHKNEYEHLGEEWNTSKSITKRIEELIKPNHSVLEIGCGGGKITKEILKITKKITVADTANKMLNLTSSRFPNIETYLIESLEWEIEHKFDAVVSYDAMVHMEAADIFYYFREIHKILKSGGIAILHISKIDHDAGFKHWVSQIKGQRLGQRPFYSFGVMTEKIVIQFIEFYKFKLRTIDRYRDLLVVLEK